jgi:hypothetical protein
MRRNLDGEGRRARSRCPWASVVLIIDQVPDSEKTFSALEGWAANISQGPVLGQDGR